MKAIIASSWFDNRDGLLIVSKSDNIGERYTFRSLLHYLLPADDIREDVQQETKKAGMLITTVAQQSGQIRSSISSCNPVLQPKRSEKNNDDDKDNRVIDFDATTTTRAPQSLPAPRQRPTQTTSPSKPTRRTSRIATSTRKSLRKQRPRKM